ncbi:pyridoxamine 5-phosphate oxidase [Ruegeria sediminis]|uniref:Pyridoxamine 5-phosphate oxidase n=1 Tax=Ruegeria sediminis TaxID=2583820 RepID=A0ABY2X4V9_9RHOB|nr:pyridoxamine 5-phosphate oxidase [Ruegeria sediminis]TMV10118.1 pyridoxamine 5-phosphate oxidase [Ruegeria sediminis]
MTRPDPFQPADDTARGMARGLVQNAAHAALAVLRPGTALPSVARIALATDTQGRPISLISSLAAHTQALEADPACALLIGEPGDKGDPLTHPRLTLHCTARLIPRDAPQHATLRDRYLALRPKAKLYADFADFRFVRFDISDGLLNAGFGRAYRLGPGDF